MVRTQVSLHPEQMDALRRLAEARGTSVAALVREGVQHVLASDVRAERHRRALQAIGIGEDEADVAAGHDDYLADAYPR